MPDISVNNLSFQLDGSQNLFTGLTFSLQKEKVGLVGDNGVGKTTLLNLITNKIQPSSGNIICDRNIGYLPQDYQIDPNMTVEQVLDFNDKNTITSIKYLKIDDIGCTRTLESLSGGEKMKILLAKIMTNKPDFLILDEPTNNLDQEAREVIYKLITNWKKGMLVVSHDKVLLNLMDRIMELTPSGIKSYGGNYDHYVEQKEIEKQAMVRQLTSAVQANKRAKMQAQKTREKQQKRTSHGVKNKKIIGVSGAVLDKMKDTGQATSSRLANRHEKIVNETKLALDDIRNKIAPENEIILDLSGTAVPAGKLVVKITNLSFAYSHKKIFESLNFVLYGSNRVAIAGSNGSGKTTLVKLILGQLLPTTGEVRVGVNRLACLDQNTDWLDKNKTMLENLINFSSLDEDRSKEWLAHFLFRGLDVYKKIKELSGGERVRAALACALAGDKPPQLLILDEPTNNLDINSIEQIESALLNYQGALIVISHDQSFLRAIGISEVILLKK